MISRLRRLLRSWRPAPVPDGPPLLEFLLCPRVPVNIWHARHIALGVTRARAWPINNSVRVMVPIVRAGQPSVIVTCAPWLLEGSVRRQRQQSQFGIVASVRGFCLPFVCSGDSISTTMHIGIPPSEATS